jgi:hypothetical protein
VTWCDVVWCGVVWWIGTVSRKVSKYHTAHQIQKELATMNAFVAQQQRKRITARGMLDRILGVHEMMVEELFMEMDDDGSGA